MDVYDDGGTQSYNGLLLSAQKRLSNNFSTSVNYTWSHCIGDFTQGGGTPNVGSGYLDPSNRRFDRGNCVADRRHIFNLTAVAETPKFAGNMTRMLLTGWKVSGIYRASSGAPLSITTNIDRQLSGVAGQRVNQVLTDIYQNRDGLNYFNPAAFALPAVGGLGNMGRFNAFGPGFFQIDTAVSRAFKIRESQTLEVRGEAFNLTNSLRRANPATISNVTNTFGQVLAAGDPRIMQFALKYVF